MYTLLSIYTTFVVTENATIFNPCKKYYEYICKATSQVMQLEKNLLPMQGMQETPINPWVGKIPWIWRRKQQPTQLFLPGKFHGVGSLMDYSPWGHKELDTTENAHSTYMQSVIGFQTHKQPFHLFE